MDDRRDDQAVGRSKEGRSHRALRGFFAAPSMASRVSQFLAPSPVRESRGHADDEWFVDLGG
jgi:hypothetical protein